MVSNPALTGYLTTSVNLVWTQLSFPTTLGIIKTWKLFHLDRGASKRNTHWSELPHQSIQQTALQIILSPSFQTHLDFSGFSVERWEHSQGILIRCRSSRSKCAYTKKALSVLSCWAWLKRGRERKLKKLPFVLKNVQASNQNTVVAKDCCSPPTISLSEQKTDVPFTSKLCSFSPKSPPMSAPNTRHGHTNSTPKPATHNSYKMHFQKIHPRMVSTKFKGAAFNLSCWQTRQQQALGCIWCIYKKPGTMFVLLLRTLSSHCRILQIAGDDYSRLNSNYWNAQTAALAEFYSWSRSLHHLWMCCCRTVVEMGFRRSELPLLPRQKGDTSK